MLNPQQRRVIFGLVEELKWYNMSFIKRSISRRYIEEANKLLASPLPSYDEIGNALIQLLDGSNEEDIKHFTGLGDEECARIYEVYSKICRLKSLTSTPFTPPFSTSSPTSPPPSST